ncbi:MAG TPA: hypothetical protein VLQ45_17855 [Thermoanaerobaculia bacterium]|nr:hypothetical protein [Thermoanaerobaculia bacterium]
MIAFALLAATAAGFPATPACRLDGELAAEVRQAATAALRSWTDEKSGTEPRFHGVEVNPTGEAPGLLAVELVSDAAADAVDPQGCLRPDAPTATGSGRPDPWTVLGVCRADSARGNRIRCSASALRALTQADRAAERPSPALLYLLAHEIAHLYQGTAASFAGPALILDTGTAPAARWRQLRPICQAAGNRQLTLEEEADQKAVAVLETALPSDAYRKPVLSPQASLYALVAEIRDAAAALTSWEAGEEAPLPPPVALRLQTLEPDDENITRTATRLLCEVFGNGGGRLILSNVPGTHPTAVARLSEISGRLQKAAAGLPFGRLASPLPGTEAVVDQLDETLIPTIGRISAGFDRSEKEFYERLWPYVCEKYLNPGQPPDCSVPMSNGDVPACPLFAGVLNETPISSQATRPLELSQNGREITIPGRVRTVLPRPGGGFLAGVAEPPSLVEWSGQGAARISALPCSPGAIATVGAETWVLCDHPFGFVVLSGGKPRSFHRLTSGVFDNEDLQPGEMEALWLGTVGSKMVAAAYLPEAGRSATFEIKDNIGFKGGISPDAWRHEGCDQLLAGMWVRLGEDAREAFAWTLRSKASLQVARLSPDLGRVLEVLNPDLDLEGREAPTLTCGFAPGPGVLCVDGEGKAFRAFPPGDPLPIRFNLTPSLQTARVAWGRLCGTRENLYLAAGSISGTEIHRWRKESAPTEPFYQDDEGNPDLDVFCGLDEAFVLLPGPETSRIILLPSGTGESSRSTPVSCNPGVALLCANDHAGIAKQRADLAPQR